MNQQNQLFIKTNNVLLSSFISADDVINFSLDNNHKYVFITEQQTISSFICFYKKSINNNLIPVLGLQFLFNNSELLLIAKNSNGYHNLIKISNEQTITTDLLSDLIVILLDGELIHEDHPDFYLANSDCAKGIYIRENKFTQESDYEYFCLLWAIKNNHLLEDAQIMLSEQKNDFLRQSDSLTEAWTCNLNKILNSISLYDISPGSDTLDVFGLNEEQASSKIQKIINDKLLTQSNPQLYRERSEYELEVIKSKKYSNYFLIVLDFLEFLTNQKILFGIGRGSVCGSLIAYLLGITGIDPIRYHLYFERFLNPNGNVAPDIDIDVDSSQIQLLLRYLTKKFGSNNVAQLTVVHQYRLKTAIKDCAKSLGIHPSKVESILKIKQWDDLDEALKNKFFIDKDIERLFFYAQKILGTPQSISINASGIIISSLNLKDHLPMISNKESMKITRFDLKEITSLGFIKFDILSLTFLELINKTIETIPDFNKDIKNLDWDDQSVYAEFSSTNNCGIFQMEGGYITKLIHKYRPINIIDLANCISLVRPGSFNHINEFLNNKNQNKSIKYLIPGFKPILEITYGVPIYQEQIMEIVSLITGCSFAESDTYRKAISKKDMSLLSELKQTFFFRGLKRDYTEQQLTEIWTYIDKFGFNKSHAVAYAKIAYQTAWFKNKYPLNFYSTLLNVFGYKPEYIQEIKEKGYKVSYPDILFSSNECFFKDKTIYIGIKKLSHKYLSAWQQAKDILQDLTSTELIKTLLILIEKRMKKEEILLLNECGFFNPLFSEEENQDFIVENIDLFLEISLFCEDYDWSIFKKKFKYLKNLTNKKWFDLKKTIYGI